MGNPDLLTWAHTRHNEDQQAMQQAMQAVVHALAAAAAVCGPVHAMQQSELQSLAEGALLEDTFGAGIACRGTRALIGAPNMSLTAQSSGAVFAFRYEGAIWRSAGPLALPVVGAGAHVGGAVCIDGDWAAIGVPYKDASGVNEGVVCVLYANQSAVGWTVSEIRRPISLETEDSFGYALAIDGDTLVAGAPGDNDAYPSAGAAYVYRRLGNAWVLEQKLVPPAASLPLSAGASVSVCGSTVVLGSTGNDFFVFERVGGSWTLAGAFEDLQNHYDDLFPRGGSRESLRKPFGLTPPPGCHSSEYQGHPAPARADTRVLESAIESRTLWSRFAGPRPARFVADLSSSSSPYRPAAKEQS